MNTMPLRASLRTVAALALFEARVQLRRPATLVALLAVAALSWLLISDPAGGHALIAAHGARIRYTSAALALGSAAQASILFALFGFYLLRGRTGADTRSGIGGVIGACQAGGAPFVAGRWCGAVLYLLVLASAFAATILLRHAAVGEGPVQPLVYLETFALVLGPSLLFAAGCAILFDSWAPLMGKAGDILYFVLWIVQIGMLQIVTEGPAPFAIPVDFPGMSAVITALSPYTDIRDTALGIADFDPRKAVVALPDALWTLSLVGGRMLSAALALAPLLLAFQLFHRYSADRVKPGRARARRSPLALLNGWLRPLAGIVRPLFGVAARLPGIAGQALGDVVLTLVAAPSAIALLLLAQVLGLALDTKALGGLLLAGVAYWGVLISDLPARDAAAGCAGMGAAVPGGASQRYWRQWTCSVLLALAFTGIAALRVASVAPLMAAALLSGVLALASLAQLLGSASGNGRAFLVLFLLGLFVTLNIDTVPLADPIGFHGVATRASVLAWTGVALAAVACRPLWQHLTRMRGAEREGRI